MDNKESDSVHVDGMNMGYLLHKKDSNRVSFQYSRSA